MRGQTFSTLKLSTLRLLGKLNQNELVETDTLSARCEPRTINSSQPSVTVLEAGIFEKIA